jgi:DNA-directed RNA polymerase specialized sigma24 family protein
VGSGPSSVGYVGEPRLHSQQQRLTDQGLVGVGWGVAGEPGEELLEPELCEPVLEPQPCQPQESLGSATGQAVRARRADETGSAAHRARIQSDAAIVQDVQLEASVGAKRQRAWAALERELYVYGFSVLPAMVSDGRMFAVAKKVLGVCPEDLRFFRGVEVTPEDAKDIAAEALSRALPAFHEDILQGRWTPGYSAATLKTFFIGKCAPYFVTAWRRFIRQRLGELRAKRALARAPLAHHSSDDVAGAVVNRLLTEKALLRVQKVQDKIIVVLDAYGLTDPEIAHQLGVSTKVVEYRLLKGRAAIRTVLRGNTSDVA